MNDSEPNFRATGCVAWLILAVNNLICVFVGFMLGKWLG